jgi:hypothetical protein
MFSTNIQAPSSREFSGIKLQVMMYFRLMFEIWSFFGAWMLAFGASIFVRA